MRARQDRAAEDFVDSEKDERHDAPFPDSAPERFTGWLKNDVPL
jgi:hypothetical protein